MPKRNAVSSSPGVWGRSSSPGARELRCRKDHALEEGHVHDRASNDAQAFAELFELRERLRVFLLA